jgi:hypothetical protein
VWCVYGEDPPLPPPLPTPDDRSLPSLRLLTIPLFFSFANADSPDGDQQVLDGEVLYREGRHAEAFAALRRAVSLVDKLPYDEPHGWLMSARQTLAALLTEQGEYQEACS